MNKTTGHPVNLELPEDMTYVRADQIAECWEGLSQSTYTALWKITSDHSHLGEPEAHEPDAPPNTMEKVWHLLTDSQKTEILHLNEAQNVEWEKRLAAVHVPK